MTSEPKVMDAVTILFTDVEGSTELMDREGDAVAGEVLRIHEQIVRDRLRAWDGRRVGFLGDGFLASFRQPRSALRCAMEIQRALETHNRSAARPVRVRIGLHHGFVREVEGQLYGQAVHAAARVMGEAMGGEIFVSEAIVMACRDESRFSFADRGLFWLKGFQERWRLYAVEWRDRDALPAVATAAERAMTPFVARDVERADLRRAVHSALAGEGGLAFVTGEAGVGKTRLTDEIAAEAGARGMRVYAGHCAEMEGGEAYLPFVEILERALVSPESPIALREALAESGPEIARLVPALRRVLPDLPPPLDLPPEQARRYLWSSIEAFLRRAAQDRPLLLALEDLHWSDESSMQLLGYLAPLLHDMPVLVIGTYRDNEFGVTHPLAGLLNRLTRRRLATRIHLQRFPEGGVAAMIRGLAGQDPPAGLVHAIYEETEGNPFFVEEVYLHLSETEALFDADGRFRSDLGIGELDVPASVRLVVGERLARLSPEVQRTLVAAAVSGRVFEPAVVGRVTGLDDAELAAVFDEAQAARVVVALPSDVAQARFGHELIRQTLLADTSAPTRQMLHARTADAIEMVHAHEVEDHAADLAFHLTRSGPGVDTARLIRYLRIAGDRAIETAAFDDAVSHLERALSLGSGGDADRAQILERLAIARRSVGRWEDALVTMNSALDTYQRLGESDAVGRLSWWMVYQLAWAARFQDAVTVAQRGLALLGDVVNPDRARLLSVTGWVVGLSGDHAAAAELFGLARSLADQLEEPRVRADVLHMEALQHMGYVEFHQGIEAGREAARVFEDDGDLWQLCGVLAFVQFQLGTILEADDARALADRVAELAQRLGHLGAQFLSVADSIRRDGVMAGDLGVIDQLARQEIEICRRGNLPWLYTGHLYLGLAAHWAGRWDDAERELRTALELEPPGAFSGQSSAHLALHLAERGRAREVLELFDGARDWLPRAGRVHGLGGWNALLGFTEALYVAGFADRAAALYPMVEKALALGEWITFDCRLVRTRAGVAAAAARRWDEAERHYDLALEKAIAIGNRIEQADIHRLRARMYVERGQQGDADRATALTAASARMYRDMGMTAVADRIEASLPGTGLAHATG